MKRSATAARSVKERSIHVRADDDVIEALQKIADKNREKLSDVVRRACVQFLTREGALK